MKKTTFVTAMILGASSLSFAQIFTDDFESYSPGYLGPQSASWTTWSGAEGGAEDVQISTIQANSGTNSIYLSSVAANGGPQDVVLMLDQLHNDGVFTYEMAMYVNAGKDAYFNIQGSNTIGDLYTMNFQSSNGAFTISDASNIELLSAVNPMTQWFTMKVEANLSTGVWEAYIDGNSVGSFINPNNVVRSIDIYPTNGSQYFVDDVMFDHVVYTAPNLNADAAAINVNGSIAGQNTNPIATIVNEGQTAITGFTATLNYNGIDYVETVSGQNIASMGSYEVNFSNVPLIAGMNNMTVTLTNINGGADDDSSDDVNSILVNPLVPAAGKMVISEEATGTWCGWCPRGTVFMDRFENKYDGFWAGIAVHNNDPMTVSEYDAGMGTKISGYPNALVDRGAEVDPSLMTPDFITRVQTAPAATLTNGATWDATSRTLSVSIRSNFPASKTGQYKMACVLTEDHVTGTGSGYNQANYYSSTSNNADLIDDDGMNWKNLSNPVPASQMEYNHVARAINGTFTGTAGCLPISISAGEEFITNFDFVLPATWDENNIHIVGMLFSPNGKIDNGSKTDISTAVTNGYEIGCSTASVSEVLPGIPSFELMPNPATSKVYLVFNDIEASTAVIQVVDMTGKVMINKSINFVNGSNSTELNTSELQKGMYIVNVVNGDKHSVRRLVID